MAKWVLILDDEQAIIETLSAILEQVMPGQVYGTADWVKANDFLRDHVGERILLICDLKMPGIRGADFCGTILKFFPNVTVVIHSGSVSSQKDLPAGLETVQFVTKGDLDKLLGLVESSKAVVGNDASGKG